MICKRCKGKGWVWVALGPDDVDRDPCDECNGTGQAEIEEGSVSDESES